VEVVLGGRSTLDHVYKRLFVDYFLRKVSTWYALVVFTASMQEYADPVIDWLDAGHGILACYNFCNFFTISVSSPPRCYTCTRLPNGSYIKDLSVAEQDHPRVRLIDNSPVSYCGNE
ncbi:NLI interacting factor, partial [Suillus cothurnatus]